MSDAHEHKQIEFFVDAKPYTTERKTMTGAEIKAQANVQADYQLFLEEEGDHPDKPISDEEAVTLSGKVKHFFAVPPATFGL